MAKVKLLVSLPIHLAWNDCARCRFSAPRFPGLRCFLFGRNLKIRQGSGTYCRCRQCLAAEKRAKGEK